MSQKSKNKATDTPPKRSFFRVGPGLIIALAISAFIGARYVQTELALKQQKNTPPIIERPVVSSAEEKLGPTPEVKFIVLHAHKLGLSQAQIDRLQRLQAGWEKFSRPKLAEAFKAARQADDYLRRSKGNRRTPSAQIQDQVQPVIMLSGELSSLRHSYWDQALKLLSPEQRKLLDNIREAEWAARTNPKH